MRTQQIIVVVLILFGAAYAIHGAMQPNLGLLKFAAKGNIAYGHGTTDDRSVWMIRTFLDDNPQVDTLIFGKMGGTMDADMNLRIARDIRRRGLTTQLTKRSYIASGAVDLFLAGKERIMECGASIGVHSWSAGPNYYPAKIGHDQRQKIQEKFLRDMGIDEKFYVFTRDASPPSDVYILTPDDVQRFNLLTQPLDCN